MKRIITLLAVLVTLIAAGDASATSYFTRVTAPQSGAMFSKCYPSLACSMTFSKQISPGNWSVTHSWPAGACCNADGTDRLINSEPAGSWYRARLVRVIPAPTCMTYISEFGYFPNPLTGPAITFIYNVTSQFAGC